jgi:MFS family permease
VAKIGKLRAILLTNIVVCVGSGIVLIPNKIALIIGRFIYGIANGSFSVFVPLFINETAPIEIKGPVGVMT